MQVYTVPGTTARPGYKTGDGQWQSREVHNTIWTEEKLTLNTTSIHTLRRCSSVLKCCLIACMIL